MKNMKKLLQKAMVFTLTAAMLVGTPMTASAAGLVDLYSISDGNPDHPNTGGDEKSYTGTVTNTDTDTNSGVLKDNYAKIIDLVLDKTHVDAVKGKKEEITATVVLDGGDDKLAEALAGKIKWQVLYADGKTVKNGVAANEVLSISASADNRSVVTLNPRKGTVIGEDMIVKATIEGKYGAVLNEETNKLEVGELTTNVTEDYTAEATVFIKEYTDKLSWKTGIPAVYVKHTLDLSKYLQRDPETANDTITWSSSDTKTATVTAAGVVTFKKTGDVKITAVSEKGKKAEKSFEVTPGTPASKVEIYKDGELVKQKIELDMGEETKKSADVTVKMYAKVEAAVKDDGKTPATTKEEAKKNGTKYVTKKIDLENGASYLAPNKDKTDVASAKVDVTDNIAWTSSKTTIATVAGDNAGATITAVGKALGTANITAKASSGKSAKASVAVKATLKKLEIDKKNIPSVLYSGQTLELKETRTPAENKDAITWSVDKVTKNGKAVNNPNASINAKGILTIKAKLDTSYADWNKVTVKLATKKAPILSDTVVVNIDQSSINSFMVYQDTVKPENLIADYVENKQVTKNKTSNIAVPKGRTYVATATASEGYTAGAETLVWKSSSEKIAKVVANGDGTAKITAVAKGTATITVSGIQATKKSDGTLKSTKVIKATFKVAVSQPTTSLTMNKTSVVLKATGKKQTVSFSVKQNKNAKETITWDYLPKQDGVSIDQKGKITLNANKYQPGNVFTVVAKSQSGVTAKATVKVVTASAAVEIRDNENEDGKTYSYYAKKSNGTKGNQVKNATVLDLGESLTLYPMVNVGGTKSGEQDWIPAGTEKNGKAAAGVTYTVSKKDIVQIIGNKVYRVNNGTVTITVKTEDGKSYKLKIDDANKAYTESSAQ